MPETTHRLWRWTHTYWHCAFDEWSASGLFPLLERLDGFNNHTVNVSEATHKCMLLFSKWALKRAGWAVFDAKDVVWKHPFTNILQVLNFLDFPKLSLKRSFVSSSQRHKTNTMFFNNGLIFMCHWQGDAAWLNFNCYMYLKGIQYGFWG